MGSTAKSSEKLSAAQAKKFADKARELGCDEDERAFEEKLKRLAQAKPKPKDKKAPDE